jgi:carboxymethylenebutenolidase
MVDGRDHLAFYAIDLLMINLNNMTMKKIWIISLVTVLSQAMYAQDHVLKQLEESPRHMEWVDLKLNDRVLKSFLVYPEVSKKVPGIILIHENRGLNDWARSMTDQVAAAGYIVMAPDMLSGKAPGGGKTSDFNHSDEARSAIYELNPGEITANLNAVFRYLKDLPACNGEVVVMGFCWGGSQTFRYMTNNRELNAGFVFYGTAPADKTTLKKINAPVYGFYGENDARVNASIPETEEKMKEYGKTYVPVIFEGGGHGFMRSGEGPDATEGNKAAREAGWKRLISLLSGI